MKTSLIEVNCVDRDSKKLWNLVAALSEEKPKSAQIVLEHEGKLCADKQAANILIKQYAETNDLQVPTDRKRETRKEQHASPVHKEEPMMNSPFVTKELEDALAMLKLRKASVPDNITNEMLLHLGPCSKKKLLQLFNDGWRTGTLPQVWREAIIIIIVAFKRAIRDFLQSPHSAANCLQHVHSSGPGATMCK